MFLVLQFPFADARGFLEKDAGRLRLPAWPLATPGKDFIRSSGPVRPRLMGGVEDWPGEDQYGDASHALKFPNRLQRIPIFANGSLASLNCAFRRFYSDGVMARMDIGFNIEFPFCPQPEQVDLVSLVRQIVELSVQVKDKDQVRQVVNLIDAGQLLAQHFLNASTDHKRTAVAPSEAWWFSAGVPSVIIEYLGTAKAPAHTKKVLSVSAAGGILSHCWLQTGRQRFSAWFVEKQACDQDALRRLRIHLVRLHAERECLKCILIHLRENNRLPIKRDIPTSECIQQYLQLALRAVTKPVRYGNNQAAILEAAQYAYGSALGGETASLEKMRRQVALQIESYVQRAQGAATIIHNIQGNYMSTNFQMGNVTVTGGDFTIATAENIKNSFNKAANSDIDPNLKEQLKDLATKVAILSKSMPQDQAERASRDLVTLTEEAVSKEPRKGLCEISGEGLISAAKTVSDMAGPITSAVKGILSLLT